MTDNPLEVDIKDISTNMISDDRMIFIHSKRQSFTDICFSDSYLVDHICFHKITFISDYDVYMKYFCQIENLNKRVIRVINGEYSSCKIKFYINRIIINFSSKYDMMKWKLSHD